MYFKFKCPHCEKSLKVREELAGRKCACPYCKGSVRIPEELAPEQPEAGFPNVSVDSASSPAGAKPPAEKGPGAKSGEEPKPKRHAHTSGGAADTSDISLLKSGLYGLAGSVAFLVLTFPLSAMGWKLGELFWDRGPAPFVMVILTSWSVTILILKWRKLKQQRQSMLLDVLPTELSAEITVESLDKFEEYIHGLPGEAGESFLINRVIRGLEHFRVRKSAAETVTMMESQSDIDANNVASSYTIIKVFIWALPIMGFIGTVMGVSEAVASLAGSLESASDISAVKESLKDVFGGLGIAFDTTLLALVLSLLVKIPQSALQKNEEDLVTWVDEYCNENLLKRLNDGREGGAELGLAGPGAQSDAFRKAVEAAMATHQAELESWSKRLETIGSKLTSQVADSWKQINTQMQGQLTEYGSQLHQQQEQHAAELLKQYEQRLAELRAQHDQDETQRNEQREEWNAQMAEMGRLAGQIQQAMAALGDQSQTIQTDMANSINGTGEALQGHFAGIERGLSSLNGVLEKLGEQQVVVQQVEAPRRGWFGRGGKGGC